MSYSSRTTRTYQYSSSGGPGNTQVTESRTVYDNDGQRTETHTTRGGNINDFNSHFGQMEVGSRPVKRTTAPMVEGRYSRGWGTKKDTRARSGPPMKLEGKTYAEIKAQCLREGRLFEDPDFPATDGSIFYTKSPPRPFVWKRPPEICSDPQFFSGGASRFDVKQGELGDCWLLAAIAGLCQYKDLFYRVVPQDQQFDNEYAGIFRFQFWQYGQWQDVIVDDRLPTYYDKLVFMHSVEKNEFWSPLLEKAYAKLSGSYETLKGGATSEAMEDFTGGVTEMYDLRQAPANLFQIMMKAFSKNSLMGCSIDANPNQLEAELSNGLIMGHAYTITNVTMIDIQTSRMKGRIPMVRVRNPWGNECEWKGAWSDKSQEWRFIPEEEKKEVGLTFDDDGEFWMAFSDFVKHFQKLEICNLGPDSLNESGETCHKTRWEGTTQTGTWRRRVNAGGCRNYLETFWTNPQYRIEVVDPDEDDDENMGTLLVALMQKGRRKLRKEGGDMLTVGYAIYKIKDDSGPLDIRYFKYNASVAKSPSFINMREICGRHKLPPGNYCIIPSTFEPNQEGEFLMRVFSEKPAASTEIDEETGMSDVKKKGNTSKRGTPSAPSTPNSGYSVNNNTDKYGNINGSRYDSPTDPQDHLNNFLNQPIKPKHEVTEADSQQEREMKEAFRKVSGEDMEIDAYELQEILNAAFLKEFRFDGFSNDTCRSMVAMMDDDRSGKLGYEEFRKLWTDIRLWKTVFKQHDKDRSGNFNSYELRMAFHSVGFKVSNGTFNALVQRYSHRDGKIYFDDFIHCVVRMKTMFEIFKEMQVGGSGKAQFDLDQFIQTTMYS